ncbi:UTRA domain-containing protein [Turicimonas muris]|uniref:UTRA domain-containing protein n=1 Tax=Turicimonas muris TaxID=1796652 RepID=UPI00272D40E0|nr:UTRA domain-containing protein [Turicimonas muris]
MGKGQRVREADTREPSQSQRKASIFYQTELGVSIGRCEETIKAALLPPNLCYMFSMPSPTPVIEIRRIAYTVNDEPVEYHRQLCITDKYHYAPMPEA